MKKAFFLFFLFPTLVMASGKIDPEGLLGLANHHYEKGEWEEALQIYQDLLRQGWVGPALSYNLGNVHYRRGERGKAVLWYRRAERMSPRDADISFNLALARSHLRDEKPGVLQKIVFYFTDLELAVATAMFSFIFFSLWGGVLLSWVKGEVWPELALWCCGIFLLISAAWFGTNLAWMRKPHAIVTSPPGEVRNGPGNDYAVGFTIPEGSEVLVLTRRPEWSQVGVPQQGLKGWLPTEDLELISPRTG